MILNRTRAVISQLKIRTCSPRPSFASLRTCSLSRRTLSSVTNCHDDIFSYTSGRWVYNEALRRKERALVFDVEGLCRLAAESVNRSPTDVVGFTKLAEGGFNRAFLVALRGGPQVVARIPYPVTAPKYYAVASEVATIEYLRSHGIPIPKVYGYSADSDNVAGTPYIVMEFVQGDKLSDVWRALDDQEVFSVISQLNELESQMMSLQFPAGGSLYFTEDLEKVSNGLGVVLEDKRFCVGPDTKLALWYSRRAGLDVSRGPYHSSEDALAAPAHKEIAYLRRFGQPQLPFKRERRPSYKFKPQFPSRHIELLERYLSIVPSLVPRDPALNRFCIRHPDLQPTNIFVSRSPDTGCRIVSLFDWQHASILPMFILAGIPQRLQNHDDDVSAAMILPSLPDDYEQLSEHSRDQAEYVYRCRLVHYHYVLSAKQYNPMHYHAFTDPAFATRIRLFARAGSPWEGESFELQDALMLAAQEWELIDENAPLPSELVFNAEELREAALLDKDVSTASKGFDVIQSITGIGEDGWVSNEDYESAMNFLTRFKEQVLAEADSEGKEEIIAHWPWDEIDEEMQF